MLEVNELNQISLKLNYTNFFNTHRCVCIGKLLFFRSQPRLSPVGNHSDETCFCIFFLSRGFLESNLNLFAGIYIHSLNSEKLEDVN